MRMVYVFVLKFMIRDTKKKIQNYFWSDPFIAVKIDSYLLDHII